MYNMTQLQEADTIAKLVVFANDATGGLLLSLFIAATFFILLMVQKRYDMDQAMMTSSAISFIIALIMVYLELIPMLVPLGFLILLSLTAFYSFMIKK